MLWHHRRSMEKQVDNPVADEIVTLLSYKRLPPTNLERHCATVCQRYWRGTRVRKARTHAYQSASHPWRVLSCMQDELVNSSVLCRRSTRRRRPLLAGGAHRGIASTRAKVGTGEMHADMHARDMRRDCVRSSTCFCCLAARGRCRLRSRLWRNQLWPRRRQSPSLLCSSSLCKYPPHSSSSRFTSGRRSANSRRRRTTSST